MSVFILEHRQIGPDSFLVRWESDEVSPVYRIYQAGQLIFTGEGVEEWIFQLEPGESLFIEILDQSDGEPTEVWSGRAVLGWQASTAVEYYRIEQYTGGAWVELDTMLDDGAPWYGYETALLDDEGTYRYRVTPVGANTMEPSGTEFNFLMVRNPDAPAVSYDYDAGAGTLTIDAL